MLGSPAERMEYLMRLTPIVLSLAIAGATLASAGMGQRPDDQIDPRSTALVEQGRQHAAAGRHNEAIDHFETALAVDPRNRAAYVALARVAQAQRLPGKAIGYYADALRIEPNDQAALAGQGEAYVQRGAVERAALRLVAGELADELLLASQLARPARLEDVGFSFALPTLEDALRHELGRYVGNRGAEVAGPMSRAAVQPVHRH